MSPDPGDPKPRRRPPADRAAARRPARTLPSHRRPPTFRWAALLLIPALLIGAGLIDEAEDRPTTGVADIARQPSTWLPSAFPAKAVGTAWYCAGGTAIEGGAADHEIYLFNPSAKPATATVTAFPSEGEPKSTTIQVKARYRAVVRLADLVQAPYAAGSVESDGSELVVQQRVSGPLGSDLSSCSTQASNTWIVTGGSTLFGNDEVLALFNPFAADATVDISFVTDSLELDARTRQPQAFQGMSVPGRSLLIARVTDEVSRQRQVVATVKATSGSIVVDQLQAYGGDLVPAGTATGDQSSDDSGQAADDSGTGDSGDGTDVDSPKPPPGLTLHPGVTVPRTAWVFPDGRKTDGAAESVVVYNPSARAADVDVGVVVETAPGAAPQPVAPFEITGLGPGEFQVIDIAAEARVPAGPAHSLTVRSVNGVPVVAQRTLIGTEPWDHSGAAAVTGSPVMATTWLLATGSALPTTTQDIVVFNPGRIAATVKASFYDSGKQLSSPIAGEVKVAPGGRSVIQVPVLGLPPGDLAAVVTSDQPVVIEQSLFVNDDIGISSSIAIPRPEGLVPLP